MLTDMHVGVSECVCVCVCVKAGERRDSEGGGGMEKCAVFCKSQANCLHRGVE